MYKPCALINMKKTAVLYANMNYNQNMNIELFRRFRLFLIFFPDIEAGCNWHQCREPATKHELPTCIAFRTKL